MIVIGSDHAGFEAKQKLITHMESQNIKYIDKGAYSGESVDYPDVALEVCKHGGMGVLICGTGIGMSIAANKVRGIRAALCHDEHTAQMSREHNDANVLCVGARLLSVDEIVRIFDKFVLTEFGGGRHAGRVDKMMDMEG